MTVRKVAIVGSSRIPFARSMGKYMGLSNQELMTACMKSLVEKCGLENVQLGEVSIGAVIKHTKEWNLAREVTFGSGLAKNTPAFDVQQACGTSLETTILMANKIALGQIDCAIAGGVDTNSDLPVVFSNNFSQQLLESYKGRTTADKIKPFLKLRPKDLIPVVPAVIEPRTGLSMGQSCEKMAKEWNISREDQDHLAYESHQKAAKAYEEGFYSDLISPFHGLDKDNNVRPDSSLEKMAKLRPAFDRESGTLTAANSTPLTDGAAAVCLATEEWAKERNLPILAYFRTGQTAAVDFVSQDGLLMAPAFAVPKMLAREGLSFQEFDFYEIHEAFAAQTLCTLKAWEDEGFCRERLGLSTPLGAVDRSKLNVKGGSVAIGHPFGATGARLVGSLSKLLDQKGSGKGLISICTAGGMGVTAILEK